LSFIIQRTVEKRYYCTGQFEPGEATLNDLSEWRKGEKPFLMVLEETLIRYGFEVDHELLKAHA